MTSRKKNTMESKRRHALTAVIPAAGFGTRMCPLTLGVPKEILPCGNVTILDRVLDEVFSSGVDKAVIVSRQEKTGLVSHFFPPEEVVRSVRSKGSDVSRAALERVLSWRERVVFVNQDRPLGLAHAVSCALPEVEGSAFVVLPDDLFPDAGFSKSLVDKHFETGLSVVGVEEVPFEDVVSYGMVKIDDHGSVVGVEEKPARDRVVSNLVVAGRLVLSPDVLCDLLPVSFQEMSEHVARFGEVSLSPCLDRACGRGGLMAHKTSQSRFDCGSLDGYARACEHFSNKD